jgi:hypothetical protein
LRYGFFFFCVFLYWSILRRSLLLLLVHKCWHSCVSLVFRSSFLCCNFSSCLEL